MGKILRKVLKSRRFIIAVIIIAVFTIGMIALSSASGETSGISDVMKQALAFFLGVIAVLIVMSIDYELYTKYWYVLYAVCAVMLIAVLFTEPINNARSWFQFFDRRLLFQPSEVSKIVLIITTAHFLVKLKQSGMSSKERFIQIIIMCVTVGIPVLLILVQPDFGTGMVFVAAVLGMLFVWGIDYKVIKYGLISVVLLAPVVFFGFLKPGQKERILVFLDPSRDPTGTGYHVIQSKLAVGSGQLTGMGLNSGTQTQLGYLFAKTTDFIFASIAEEMGFIVSAILIILLILLVINCYGVAKDARDEEGRLIAVGIGTMFAFHILINVGMTMGLVPVTGIPLPFVSYGGSSMLTNMIAIGVVMGIASRKAGLRF